MDAESNAVGLGSWTRCWSEDADVGTARGGRDDVVVMGDRGWTSAEVRGSEVLVVCP